jgi:porphobilinogen deaminase
VAAYAELVGEALELRELVASADGSRVVRARATGAVGAPEALGHAVWQALVAAGARELLPEADRV